MKVKFLDLGQQPIANNFLLPEQVDDEFKYHLTVEIDDGTKLVSLGEFVAPEKMFNDTYAYHSSGSKTMQEHFKKTAIALVNNFAPLKVLEIGSNDGVFIKNINSDIAIAVEPCSNFADLTNKMGYKTISEFWTLDLAKEIRSKHGAQDLIYAANCMCHIQNLSEAFAAVNECLSDRGVFVFEDPSLSKMIERCSYDQIYDEHAHIFSVTALNKILASQGLYIFRVEKLNVHGGSNRIFASKRLHKNIEANVDDIMKEEFNMGLEDIRTYNNFATRVEQSRVQLLGLLKEFKRKNFNIVGYGATSKSTTVFNYCGIDSSLIGYITDTTPTKQGKVSPGMHIPVVPREGNLNSVDYAYLGAWNYEAEIAEKESEFLRSGAFITHVPYVRIIR